MQKVPTIYADLDRWNVQSMPEKNGTVERLTVVEPNGTERELTCEEKLDSANTRIKELEHALRKEIEFKTARDFPRQAQKLDIWLPAIEALPFFVKLRQGRDRAVDHNEPWRRILFNIAEDGKVLSCGLEEEE